MGQWCLGPLQSRHLGTSHSSPSISSFVQSTLQHPILESPSAAPLYFPESLWLSEISSLSKVILVLGKARSASSSHTVSLQSLLTAACTHSTFSGVLLVAGLPEHGSLSTDSRPSLEHLCHTFICASLTAWFLKGFWITRIVSTEECASLMQNLMQICCSTHSVILNATATQDTCSLSGIYHPHWPVQWKCQRSCTRIPVHSPWLPGYISVAQIVLVTLTMAGLFPDRPCMWHME